MSLDMVKQMARDKLVVAALRYTAAEYDGPGPYYDAELELRENILDSAVAAYVQAQSGAIV